MMPQGCRVELLFRRGRRLFFQLLTELNPR